MKLSKDAIRIIVGLVLLAVVVAVVYFTGGFEKPRQNAYVQPDSGAARQIPPDSRPAPTDRSKVFQISGAHYFKEAPYQLKGTFAYPWKSSDLTHARLEINGNKIPLLFEASELDWSVVTDKIFKPGLNKFSLKADTSLGSVNQEFSLVVASLEKNGAWSALDVDWLANPVRISKEDLFGRSLLAEREKMLQEINAEYYSESNKLNLGDATAYKTGVVRGGTFDHYGIYFFDVGSGLCFDLGCLISRFVVLKGSGGTKLWYLARHSDPGENGAEVLWDGVLVNATLPSLSTPGEFIVNGVTLHTPNGYYDAGVPTPNNEYDNGDAWFFERELVPVGAHPRYGTVYTTAPGESGAYRKADNLFYLRRPDGRIRSYEYDIPFLPDRRIPQITWSDGAINKTDYGFRDESGGCGPQNYYAVRPENIVKPGERLIPGGTAGNGDTIYVLKDNNDPELKELFSYRQSYRSSEEAAPSYESFLAMRPMFYWKDPFGRWIRFARTDFLPAVECGKPVIYLYPPKEMDAKVFVGLKGPMTKSEPAHGSTGWSVVARPDGFVVNKADGRTYPNLYWEGFGVNYQTPKQGFVVEAAKADEWLTATLHQIGFTDRENREFREFWVPRLPSAGLVFITFVPQFYFDRDAPLRITPKPDAVTRIFMEWKPLAAPVVVEPLQLPKIIRRGFTVVEWGGALH